MAFTNKGFDCVLYNVFPKGMENLPCTMCFKALLLLGFILLLNSIVAADLQAK